MKLLGKRGGYEALPLRDLNRELYEEPKYQSGVFGQLGNYFGKTARAGVAGAYLAGVTGASIFGSAACSPTEPTDMCLNIEGRQISVPSGYARDQNGNCYPIPPATSSITLTLRDTLTGRPINGFIYDVCSVDAASLSKQVEGMTRQQAAQVAMSASTVGMKPATGSTITEVVKNGACTWTFSGSDIEIPRYIDAVVNSNTSDNVLVIGGGSNFPVGHYINITVSDIAPTIRFRPGVTNFPIYAVGEDLFGEAQGAASIIKELYNPYNSSYAGVVESIPPSPAEGSIYVRREDSIIIDGKPVGGTVDFNFAGDGHISYVIVRRTKSNNQNSTNHEIARTLGFRGNGSNDSTSIYYIFGNPPSPNENDRKAVAVHENRPKGSTMTTSADRSGR